MQVNTSRENAPRVDSWRTLVAVWAGLLALLGLTIAVARLHLTSYSVVLNLLIATGKAGLVLLFFMHLRSESRFVKVMLGVTLAALTLIIILTFSDVWFRR
ncbi:MAG: cytochrome C oxidase subunit IV family protein [Candidatus Aminicenantales bacterium]